MKCLIFGCGYLGSEVARVWNQPDNEVHVVTRDQKNAMRFRELGYQTHIADITQSNSLASIEYDVDVVLFSVGFDRSRYDDIREVYVEGLGNVLNQIGDQAQQFIYISSTGVYGNCGGERVDEQTEPRPVRPGGKACLAAESLIHSSQLAERSTILRLAGIYGPNRIPKLAAIMGQDWAELGHSGHINLIHNGDAARIVNTVAQQSIVKQMFLVSDGYPVDRRTFYEYIAEQLGTSPIDWSVGSKPAVSIRAQADKRICNQKLVDRTGYRFAYPDFRSGVLQAIKESQ